MTDRSSTEAKLDEYDFIVIGGGSAGYAAARTASEFGLQTLVIEGGKDVGGLCILRGCMPSKTLIESANRFITIRRAQEFGLRAEKISVVQPEILARKRRLIGEFAEYRASQLEHATFHFYRGRARFLDSYTLEILDLNDNSVKTKVRGKSFLIATGSHIRCPFVPGLEDVGFITSDQLLELSELPKSIIVLGAGAIGLETAHQLAGLDVEVTIIQRNEHLLKSADVDVTEALRDAFNKRGIKTICTTHLVRVDKLTNGKKRVSYRLNSDAPDAPPRTAEAEQILCALGRRPATEFLNLEKADIHTDKRTGAVLVNDHQRAISNEHVFAAGDVCGPYEIVHIAIQQAEVAARNAAFFLGRHPKMESPQKIDYRLRLFVLFTQPQIGMIGETENELREKGIPYRSAKFPFADHGKSIVTGETEGFVKLIAHPETKEILGACVVGPQASELIHEISVAMYFRATAHDLLLVPHYHPTLSEIWTYPAEELAEERPPLSELMPAG